MKRYGRLMLASLVVIALAGSAAAQNFTNPSSVNLLECWNPDGSYGVGVSIKYTSINAAGILGTPNIYDATKAANVARGFVNYFRDDGNAKVVGGPGGAWYEVTYTFDQAVTIGQLAICFTNDTSGTFGARYQWVDGNGTFLAGYTDTEIKTFYHETGGTLTSGVTPIIGPKLDTVVGGSVTTQTLTLRVYLDPNRTETRAPRIYNLGVYLASGQNLAINSSTSDRNYNLFYEPYQMTVTKTGTGAPADSAFKNLTDHALGSYDPNKISDNLIVQAGSSWGASIVYEFTALEDGYTASGFMLSSLNNGSDKNLTGLKLELSFDNVTWTTVWSDALNNSGTGLIYNYKDTCIPLTYDGAFKYARLSWDGGGTAVNNARLTEFQLFGGAFVKIPEPATMSLLALGGLAMLRRRGR